MRRTLSNTWVRVMVATSAAADDSGEQRSPTKEPARIAPPTMAALAFMAVAMVMQMTPTVAEAAYELPVTIDMNAQRRKLTTTRVSGLTTSADQQVMDGIVPAARHDAVRAPIMTKKRRTPPMVRTPSRAMPATARGLCPRARP